MSETRHILVVDDEQEVRDTLYNVLKSLDYVPHVAASGKEALEIIKNERIDVVLSDLYMPEMDGIELLKRVKAMNSKVVFLMITAHPTIETAVDAIKKGAYDYLTKPFHIEEVRLKINRALERKGMASSLKTANGIIWALIFSIPLWLILGIILARLLK
ncbi:sigma-54-dependent transcriptional regulator [Caldithrix abyssi]|uniref:Response regulator receiver protein n=1 Tax=Caldithrix abyssi DSM 13497 TaxID=880073 RepID=H1XW24_CALAY|nr:response regulator [Caldithrix abyssi]APF17714.1 two-component system, NtrC family, response regulator/two-component system, NtrC family, response regulator PilR [Caldithrix abyssi DSM 13497]EHO41796.1 response regulator receiver protein [Caldithrix abyssi DSM 13497]